MIAAMVLCAVACSSDEPDVVRPHYHDNAADTTGTAPKDTTGTTPPDTTGNDTIPPFSLEISAPRDYGYMGQTLSLTAVTSAPATVQWRSLNTTVATVTSEGTVTLVNTREDGIAPIVASANGRTDTLLVHNRMWQVAAWSGGKWSTSANHTAHPGDTITMTIVDSQQSQVVDNEFHAGACQWSVSSRSADVSHLLADTIVAAAANGWHVSWIVAGNAPPGATFTVMAKYGDAASSLSCVIR